RAGNPAARELLEVDELLDGGRVPPAQLRRPPRHQPPRGEQVPLPGPGPAGDVPGRAGTVGHPVGRRLVVVEPGEQVGPEAGFGATVGEAHETDGTPPAPGKGGMVSGRTARGALRGAGGPESGSRPPTPRRGRHARRARHGRPARPAPGPTPRRRGAA